MIDERVFGEKKDSLEWFKSFSFILYLYRIFPGGQSPFPGQVQGRMFI